MEEDPNIFVSKIPIKYYQSRELYELLVTENVEPAKQNIKNPGHYACPLKRYRSYVSRRISRCKVKTIGMIRKKYEDGVRDHLPGRIKTILKDQFNSLSKLMRNSLYKEEQLFAKELLKSSSPISQLAWYMLRHINVDNFKYPKQSVLWNGINILINGSRGSSEELLCNFDIGATAIQAKNADVSESINTQTKNLTGDTVVYDINTFPGKQQEHLKDLSVRVPHLNCSNIEPLCMVHKLYKCFCKGKYLGSPPSKFVCHDTVAQNMIVQKEKNTNYSTVLNEQRQNEERKLMQKANESIVCSLNDSEVENVKNDELRNETETSNGGSTSERTAPSRTFSLWLCNEYYYMKHHLSCGDQFILEKPYPNQTVLFPYCELLNKYKLAKNYFLVSTKHPHRVHIAIDSEHKEFNDHIEIHCICTKELSRHCDFVKHLILRRRLENHFVVLQGHLNSWEVKALVSQNSKNSSCNETTLAITIFDPNNPITFGLSNVKRCIASSPQRNNLHQNYLINQQAKLTPSATKTVADSNNAVNICQPNCKSNNLDQPEALSQKFTSLENCPSANEELKCAHYAKDSLNSNAHENKTDVHDQRWFIMLIEKDLTRIHLHINNRVMFVKCQKIMSVIELAHSSNKNLFIPFSGKPGQFGIYLKPSIPKNYATIGPYEKGDKYFIESFNESNQKILTRGYWVTTQKCNKHQEQERGPKISINDANEVNMPKTNYLERNVEDKNIKNLNSPPVAKTSESPVWHNQWQPSFNKLASEPLKKNYVLPAGISKNANSSTDNAKFATTQLYRIPRYPVITSVGTLIESDIKNKCSPANALHYLIQDQYDKEKNSQDMTNHQINECSEQKQADHLMEEVCPKEQYKNK